MRIILRLILLGLIFCFLKPSLALENFSALRVDKSSQIFLPSTLRESVLIQNHFSVFWWNFILVEANPWQEVVTLCEGLKSISSELGNSEGVAQVECQPRPEDYKSILGAWAMDLPLRKEMPKSIHGDLQKTKALLSLAGHEMSELLLNDPLQTWHQLRDLFQMERRISLSKKDGIYLAGDKALLPIKMSFPPDNTNRTMKLISSLPQNIQLLGPHKSYLENENVVMSDVKKVGLASTLSFLGLTLFFAFSRRIHLTALIVPILFSVLVSSYVVQWIYGSIHGLTLAFGSGIIGLALDYGLHGALGSESKHTWTSNALGFLTTAVGLIVLSFSEIPLLRQMSLFGLMGLSLGFLLMYFLLSKFTRFFRVEPLNVPPRIPFGLSLTLVCVIAGVCGLSFSEPNLSMKRLSFESSNTLGKLFLNQAPLLRFHYSLELDESVRELQWARENQVAVENLAVYLPPLREQERNIATWKDCHRGFSSPQDRKLFGNHVLSLCLAKPRSRSPYVEHLISSLGPGDSHLSLFWPKDSIEDNMIREKFKDARSLQDITSVVPKTLKAELGWMFPLSLILVALTLGYFERRFLPVCLALLPFFTGLGLVFIFNWGLGREFSFITLVGLVMMFGFSIDYGIFMNDVYRGEENFKKVVSALVFAALTNLAGFAPLLTAEHPVLKDLGVALFFGTLGSFIGAVGGIPAIAARFQRLGYGAK